MRKSELIKIIRKELSEGEHPGVKRVIDLLDVFIAQGGATLGDVTKVKKMIECSTTEKD